ncbi:uncharacterized protein C1orf131 homolog [Uranotaenia lowii]|uniref:uncharacterized protein C1orf131 homolog n=1 Tax=Uranotaenia lowii TaxID=190385 RepID=UPI00247A8078|nr:uncharacterized protein C1orf131 homolog [Uranotaenia lowii]
MSSTIDFKPILTKASLLMQGKAVPQSIKVTVYEPKKAKASKPKYKKPEAPAEPDQDNTDEEENIDDIFSNARRRKPARKEPETFDISRARKEVINFGISGLDKETKHEAQVALAIKLGAKPPKNKYRNYKEILLERKREKEETDRTNRRRRGRSFGAIKSFQEQQQRARKKATDSGSVTRHYGVVNPKIGGKKRRKP